MVAMTPTYLHQQSYTVQLSLSSLRFRIETIALTLIYTLSISYGDMSSSMSATDLAVSFKYSDVGVSNSEERLTLNGTRFGGFGNFEAFASASRTLSMEGSIFIGAIALLWCRDVELWGR